MRRRSTRKKTAADLFATPQDPPEKAPGSESPKGFKFDFEKFRTSKLTPPLASLQKQRKKANILESSAAAKLAGPSMSSPAAGTVTNLTTISDLNDMASSRLGSVKRYLDHSHSEIFKDLEASQSRLHKRLKIQTQSCQQVVDEAEREFKKMSDRIDEGREAMKASYSEFMTEVQASSSRVFKASLPELLLSFEKAIDSLKSRYGVASASAC